MVLVTQSKRLWLIGMAVSLVIFGVIYFAVIRPDNNAANAALKSGLQQSQQALNQASKQISNAAGQAGAASSTGSSSSASGAAGAATSTATKTLNKAEKLTSCIAAAGTDTTKLAACQSQYGAQ
jgi:hypothetical protein